jgi:aryl-alcohol dehydrogenase-like predicted oxidoreductase
MHYKKLGRTELEISAIGLGTMTWGLQNTQEEGFAQMDYALEQGINFFDTAEMYAIPPSAETYGTTETIIGNWFASRGTRDKVILASKITSPGLAWIRNGEPMNRNNIRLAVEGSLKRLQTDYIDVYQLHWPNRGSYHFGKVWDFNPEPDREAIETDMLETLETMQALIDEGKIRHFALSNETAWGLSKWLELSRYHDLPRAVSIQNEYSLLCRIFEPDLSEIAIQEECGLLAWSPMARGILSGKYLNGAQPEGARLTIETRPEHRKGPAIDAATQRYMAIAKKHGLEPTQMAYAFVTQQPFVSSTLIGATNMAQLKSNIDSIHVKLSDEILAEIARVRREYPMLY